jgi:itaconate CoA-transferase
MSNAPLSGLTVLAIEQAVAAPFCTARLADAGARVIKIERPEGDFARYYDDATPAGSSYFVWLNRGKESVVLDLREENARRKMNGLISQADILVQNLKPGAMKRLGFSAEQVRARSPSLVYCSISGYGEDGPLAMRKAYDLLIQAESGLASITGSPGEPARVGISVVDIATGATAHAAILEALIDRGRTGHGADIRISMFDVLADWLTVPLLNTEAGKPPQRIGLAHPSIAPYGVFSSADRRLVLIAIHSEREWRALCNDVLQMPRLLEESRFNTNVARVQHRAETDETVSAGFAAMPISQLVARLTKADIAFAELNDMAALSKHPHLRRIAVQSSYGPISFPAPAAIVQGETREYGAVPAKGEHTGSVLAELASLGETKS